MGVAWLTVDITAQAWVQAVAWFAEMMGLIVIVYDVFWREPDIDQSILQPLKIRLGYDTESDREGEWFHHPYPKWPDYRDGCVALREDIVTSLEDHFNSSKIQLLFGESGAGKTTLATLFGYRWLEDKKRVRDVYFADRLDSSSDMIIEQLLRVTEGTGVFWRHLVIIDNIHADLRVARRVFENRQRIMNAGIYVLLVARCTRTPPKEDLSRLISEITGGIKVEPTPDHSRSLDELLSVLHLKREMFPEAVDALFDRFIENSGYKVCEGERDFVLTEIKKKSQHSLWLISFLLRALRNHEGCISHRFVESINIEDNLEDFYDEILEKAEVEDTFLPLTMQYMTKQQRLNLYHRVLAVISIFSENEIPVPMSFIHECLETNKDVHRENFVGGVLGRLKVHGHLVTSRDESYVSLPHLTIAQLLPLTYKEEYEKVSFQNFLKGLEPDTQWPYEQSIIALIRFLKDNGETVRLAELVDTLDSLSPISFNKNEVWVLLGYLKVRVTMNHRDAKAWFRLGECYMFINQIDNARRALKEAISLERGYIASLGIIGEDGAMFDAYPHVYEMARMLYRKLQPWYEETTDESVHLLPYDEFSGIEVKGHCPFCSTELYGEMDIPVPLMLMSISQSETVEGCTIECTGCEEVFDFMFSTAPRMLFS